MCFQCFTGHQNSCWSFYQLNSVYAQLLCKGMYFFFFFLLLQSNCCVLCLVKLLLFLVWSVEKGL